MPVRTFRPELSEAAAGAPRADAPELRLRRVVAAAHLRDRMAWRVSKVEYGFHEDLRWAEEPGAYADRALERALFQSGACRRTEAPGRPAAEVELRAFEGVRSPSREAVVTLAVRLWDERGVGLSYSSSSKTGKLFIVRS